MEDWWFLRDFNDSSYDYPYPLYQDKEVQPVPVQVTQAQYISTPPAPALRRISIDQQPAPACRLNPPKGETPREIRNKAEKLRRDKFNESISKLRSIVPPVAHPGRKIDKTSILRLAAHYLRSHQYVFGDSLDQTQQFSAGFARTFLKMQKGFLITTTYKGIIVVVSPNIEEYLGYSELELLGQNVFNIVHEEDHAILREQLLPKSCMLGSNGQLLLPDGPDAIKNVADQLANDRRVFIIRFKKLSQQRSEPPQYVTCNVDGSLRKSDKACSRSSRYCHIARRARFRGDNYYSSGNDVVFIGLVRPRSERFFAESAIESFRMEYRTRHSVDGEIIQCEQRIALVTGYMMHEVSGVNAMNFMHRDDVRWVIIALRQMYDQNRLVGESCYRLMTKNGQFIYMRTYGQLDVDKDSKAVTSFVCINTVVEEQEGQRLIKLMKKKFTLMLNNNEDTGSEEETKEDESNGSLAIEDPRQLQKVILHLVTDLSPPTNITKDCRLAIIPPKRERIVCAIKKSYSIIKNLKDPEKIMEVNKNEEESKEQPAVIRDLEDPEINLEAHTSNEESKEQPTTIIEEVLPMEVDSEEQSTPQTTDSTTVGQHSWKKNKPPNIEIPKNEYIFTYSKDLKQKGIRQPSTPRPVDAHKKTMELLKTQMAAIKMRSHFYEGPEEMICIPSTSGLSSGRSYKSAEEESTDVCRNEGTNEQATACVDNLNISEIPVAMESRNEDTNEQAFAFVDDSNISAIPEVVESRNEGTNDQAFAFVYDSNISAIPGAMESRNEDTNEQAFAFVDDSNISEISVAMESRNEDTNEQAFAFVDDSNISAIPEVVESRNEDTNDQATACVDNSNISEIPGAMESRNKDTNEQAFAFVDDSNISEISVAMESRNEDTNEQAFAFVDDSNISAIPEVVESRNEGTNDQAFAFVYDSNISAIPGAMESRNENTNEQAFAFVDDSNITEIPVAMESRNEDTNEQAFAFVDDSNISEIPVAMESRNEDTNEQAFAFVDDSNISAIPEVVESRNEDTNDQATACVDNSNISEIPGAMESRNKDTNEQAFAFVDDLNISEISVAMESRNEDTNEQAFAFVDDSNISAIPEEMESRNEDTNEQAFGLVDDSNISAIPEVMEPRNEDTDEELFAFVDDSDIGAMPEVMEAAIENVLNSGVLQCLEFAVNPDFDNVCEKEMFQFEESEKAKVRFK